MKSIIVAFAFLLSTQSVLQAQSFIIVDAATRQPLSGVSVLIEKTNNGASSDTTGKVFFTDTPPGEFSVTFSMISFTTKTLKFIFPLKNAPITVEMERAEAQTEEEVIVSSSRTESRIENLPTKVEVLGAEEVNEEVGIKPGNIASLLGDVAGIQIQQTSAATGNIEMRVQGLPGKYTQLLKDGMPLFGGYAGSFSILQIPPLDLKQIEIVKGASSTLYGGGAIAGMVNLISKRPKEGVFEKTLLLNQSDLNESNANIYLSNKKNKIGYTFFSGVNYQKAKDVNKDGFSDLPKTNGYFIHPVLFLYPDKKNNIYIGYNGAFEKRKGGDMLVIDNKSDNLHQYFVSNKSFRHTLDASWENRINTTDRFTLKGTGSWLSRDIATNVFGMKAKQLSWYTEASYLKKWEQNDLVLGLNLNGENFTKKLPDSTQINNYNQTTIGVFLQDDWKINPKFIVQTGFRIDHHSDYGTFALPRISMLYKINPVLTSRLGFGLGYKTPTVFSNEIDERDLKFIFPLQNIKAERSAGVNWDVNYHQKINGWDLTVNQSFFYNQINKPVIAVMMPGSIEFVNESNPVTTGGIESYVQILHDALEIYLGYIYTNARKKYDEQQPHLELIAKNKLASIIAYEFSDHFRAGLESAYTGSQYLSDGSKTPGYLFAAAMVRYDIHHISLVLNCENLLDYRQTRKEQIVIPPFDNPSFKELWAPIDGRVINLSMRISL
ncbi:MAG TPA: TonB-dependent receptor [Chitinophagaceae bacterium]|nr:TonB-dependent receptor [Chitinophagaceae bacterium]MCB9055306.1 TonB-dependent receptor [Chitinophagales bacterium]HPG11751.1 TonB-dependent receptor [Chitinophagaceae bacterium]